MVGLTGGIGTGKSTVASMFEKRGAVVLDADAIVHQLQAAGMPMLVEIARAFGKEILQPNGSLDRERLGQRVFADPAARAELNRIVHPEVGREMLRRLQEAQRGNAPLVVLDIPLLLEGRTAAAGGKRRAASASELTREVIVVYAPRSAQIERQMARDGITRDHAEERIAAQLPIDRKREMADHVIDNSGTLEETEAQVRALFERLAALEAEGR